MKISTRITVRLNPAARVMHDKFGLGKVTDVTGAGDMQKATVILKEIMLNN